MAQERGSARIELSQLERTSWTLPLFLTKEARLGWGILLYVWVIFVYLTTNHYHWYEPRPLPFTWVDIHAPFYPTTVWIYLSEYPLFAITYFLIKDMKRLNRFFYAMAAMQLVNGLIFTFFPTTYPRHAFPLPESLDAVTAFAFNWLRVADSPANCFPSLHVSGIFLNAFAFWGESRRKFALFFFWGLLICISTLTTKQHYFADIVGGLVLAMGTHWLFEKKVQYLDYADWMRERRK